MPFMNIFEDDAFSLAEMTDAIERMPTNPATLGQLNIFNNKPIRNTVVGIEERKGQLKLIKMSQRGAPVEQGTGTKSKLRYFGTERLAKGDVIQASELAFVRSFGTEDQIKSLQVELAMRLNGPDGLLADMEYTKEYMRLGAIQGKFLDSDGSVIYDYFAEFEITPPTIIAFDLANTANGDLRELINTQVVRPMRKISQGARYTGITALCSAGFIDALVKNPEVRKTVEALPEQLQLRNGYDGISLEFGGVTWKEYIGDDADVDIAIPTDECVFIPTGVGNGIFEAIYSPAESFSDINTLGREVYSYTTPDLKHDRYVELEVASYPLFINKRPDMLFKGKLGA